VGFGGVDATPFIRNSRQSQLAQGVGANSMNLGSKLDVWGHAITSTLELPTLPILGDLIVKSITAKRHKKNEESTDIDGTGFRIFESAVTLTHSQFSQELQFNGVADDVRVRFLSGGFNARNVNNPNFGPTPNPFGRAFDPETLLSYELGLRSDLLERRVRFNATFFYYDYKDIQVSVFDPGSGGASTVVQNAGIATLWGAEIELTAQPFEGVELNLAYGYTKARYDKFVEDVGAGPVDVSKQRHFAMTPEHSLLVGGQYQLPPFLWGTVLGRIDWIWDSAVGFSDSLDPAIDEASSWLLHGMLQVADLELPGDLGTGRLRFWVKNITNESFKEFGFNLGPLGWAMNTYTDPRTYGATFVWEWEK
jgi:iron complex outermembrane receptor protein